MSARSTEVRALAVIAHHEAIGFGKDYRETPAFKELVDTLIDMERRIAEFKEREASHHESADRILARAERVVTNGLINLAATPLRTGFHPHGFFVYLLRDAAGEVIYVGQSTNVLSRLGSHLNDRTKRRRVDRIDLIECSDRRQMDDVESRLISEYQPDLNVRGIRRSSFTQSAPDFDALDRSA